MDALPAEESLEHAQARIAHYRSVLRRAGQELARRLARLDSLAAAVGQASEPTGVLQEALGAALGMFDADTGAIVVIEDEGQPPTLGAQHQLAREFAELLTGRRFEAAALLLPPLLSGEALTLSVTDERRTSPPLRELLAWLRLSWLVSLPLRSGGKLLGALLLGGRRAAVITVQDTHWLALVGQQAALALETIRLRKHMWSLAEAIFGQEPEPVAPSVQPSREPPEDLEALLEAMMAAEDEVQRFNQDLAALNQLAEALSESLNPLEVVRVAVEHCARILGLEKAWIYLVDTDQPGMTIRAQHGLSQRYLQARGRLSLSETLEAEVLAGGEVVLRADQPGDGQMIKLVVEAEGLRAQCLAPLRARDWGLGVLGGAHTTAHNWTARETRMLRAIASHTSLALYNAWLFERMRDSAQAQEMGNRVLQDLNRHLVESQAAELSQLESVRRSEAALRTAAAQSVVLREQVMGLVARLRALCAPEAGALTPHQQAQTQAMVRELAALTHGLSALEKAVRVPEER